jgi:hypothetical protein
MVKFKSRTTQINIPPSASELRPNAAKMDYSDAMEASFALGPSWMRRCAGGARRTTAAICCILQIVICSVYVIFIAEHTKKQLEANTSIKWDKKVSEDDIRVSSISSCL